MYALEQQKYGEGQTEGVEEGHKNHYQQGFLLGWQQACHLLHELGTVEGERSTFIAFENYGDCIQFLFMVYLYFMVIKILKLLYVQLLKRILVC